MKTVSIIGAGRMGGALTIALSAVGYTVENLFYRGVPHRELRDHPKLSGLMTNIKAAGPIRSEIVFVTTSDAGVEPAAREFSFLINAAAVVLHTSGSLSSGVLSAVAENGNPTGSMHPLVSISSPMTGAESFRDVFFCVEGVEAAVSAAEEVVLALGGRPFSIPPDSKPLYHAAAVLASGHMVALFQTARETLAACGVDPDFASVALLPLVESTLKNLSERPPEAALTGPFARADLGTIERHLDAFGKAEMERHERIYLELGSIALELAESGNAPPSEVERIRERLKLALASAK